MSTNIKVVKGDKGYQVEFALQDANGNVYDLTAASLTFRAQKQGEATATVEGSMSIVVANEGTCTYTVADGDFAESGLWYAEIEANYGSGSQIVTWNDIVVEVKPELPR